MAEVEEVAVADTVEDVEVVVSSVLSLAPFPSLDGIDKGRR